MNALDTIEAAFELLQGKRLLDVGCGSGGLCRVLAPEGAHPVGIDPSSEALRRTVPGAPFLQAAAQALPFKTTPWRASS